MIMVYIWFRFEWQFAVGAVVTLVLDITKAIGFLAITRIEFDLVMVAAILTVLGYSTNDKVVVYDRVRENLRKYKTMPLRELIDLSINETLNRTLGTSMTVFLASVPLALFGGESISGFAWVMLFGIVVGTSSSIFIAAPILLFLGEHRLRREGAQAARPPKGWRLDPAIKLTALRAPSRTAQSRSCRQPGSHSEGLASPSSWLPPTSHDHAARHAPQHRNFASAAPTGDKLDPNHHGRNREL